MAKPVKQPAYAVTVGHYLDVSQAYLAMPTSGRRHPVQQFQIGGEYVAR